MANYKYLEFENSARFSKKLSRLTIKQSLNLHGRRKYNQNMKVLIVETDTHSANWQPTAQLVSALSKTIEITVIAPTGVAPKYFSRLVNLLPLPMRVDKKSFLLNTLNPTRLLKFLSAIRTKNSDIIHFREPFQLWPALVLPWLRKYKIVTSFFEVTPLNGRIDKVISRKDI